MTETPRVIVGVRDRVGDAALLHRAAAEARRRHALLVPVLAWTPAGGQALHRARACPGLEAAWEREARAELDELVTDAFGPEEPVRVQPVVVRAESLRGAVAAVAVREGDTVFAEPSRLSLRERLGLRHHGGSATHGHRVAVTGQSLTLPAGPVPPATAPRGVGRPGRVHPVGDRPSASRGTAPDDAG